MDIATIAHICCSRVKLVGQLSLGRLRLARTSYTARCVSNGIIGRPCSSTRLSAAGNQFSTSAASYYSPNKSAVMCAIMCSMPSAPWCQWSNAVEEGDLTTSIGWPYATYLVVWVFLGSFQQAMVPRKQVHSGSNPKLHTWHYEIALWLVIASQDKAANHWNRRTCEQENM